MIILEIKVTPNAGKQKWALDKAGRLKCYLKSPPERGLANKELITFLADSLGVARINAEIVGGATSRLKRVKVFIPFTFPQIIAKLGIETQQTIF
jgi:uncharacterized protein (TIGR00251 family)